MRKKTRWGGGAEHPHPAAVRATNIDAISARSHLGIFFNVLTISPFQSRSFFNDHRQSYTVVQTYNYTAQFENVNDNL
ncbi:hypothetical protein KBB17_02560 [Candidatus Saccharibacteria bacterium]|nr:hypothetical protein [Candidatus Saccharibacteria bacterium]